MWRRYVIWMRYDGSNMIGYAKDIQNKELISVQAVIENSLYKIFNKDYNINIYASSRTDAGVHAYNNVAHFDIPKELYIKPNILLKAMNFHMLTNQIDIINCGIVNNNNNNNYEEFHSRYDAIERHYRYRILHNVKCGRNSLLRRKAWVVRDELNISKMKEASELLVGKDIDFSSFQNSGCYAKSPIQDMNNITFRHETNLHNEYLLSIDLSAPRFLLRQVRNIIAMLIDVGRGKLEINDVYNIIKSRDRRLLGNTAPAHGLYLLQVDYKPEDLNKLEF